MKLLTDTPTNNQAVSILAGTFPPWLMKWWNMQTEGAAVEDMVRIHRPPDTARHMPNSRDANRGKSPSVLVKHPNQSWIETQTVYEYEHAKRERGGKLECGWSGLPGDLKFPENCTGYDCSHLAPIRIMKFPPPAQDLADTGKCLQYKCPYLNDFKQKCAGSACIHFEQIQDKHYLLIDDKLTVYPGMTLEPLSLCTHRVETYQGNPPPKHYAGRAQRMNMVFGLVNKDGRLHFRLLPDVSMADKQLAGREKLEKTHMEWIELFKEKKSIVKNTALKLFNKYETLCTMHVGLFKTDLYNEGGAEQYKCDDLESYIWQCIWEDRDQPWGKYVGQELHKAIKKTKKDDMAIISFPDGAKAETYNIEKIRSGCFQTKAAFNQNDDDDIHDGYYGGDSADGVGDNMGGSGGDKSDDRSNSLGGSGGGVIGFTGPRKLSEPELKKRMKHHYFYYTYEDCYESDGFWEDGFYIWSGFLEWDKLCKIKTSPNLPLNRKTKKAAPKEEDAAREEVKPNNVILPLIVEKKAKKIKKVAVIHQIARHFGIDIDEGIKVNKSQRANERLLFKGKLVDPASITQDDINKHRAECRQAWAQAASTRQETPGPPKSKTAVAA